MPIDGSSRTQSLQEDGKNLDWENRIERKNLRKKLGRIEMSLDLK